MLVIEDLSRRLGSDGQIQWRESHPVLFQSMVVDMQLRLEAGLEDRSRPGRGRGFCKANI